MTDTIRVIAPDDPLLFELVALALRNPLDNAFLIADLTQLRHHCTTAAIVRDQIPVAVASFYRDLSFRTIALMADNADDARVLVAKLVRMNPELGDGLVYDFYTRGMATLLRESFAAKAVMTEYQMVLKGAIPEIKVDSAYIIRRLTSDDLPAVSNLFVWAPVMAWTPRSFEFGPFYGAFCDGELVSIAGVHYAVPQIAEVGNIATHPEHRGHNLAYACTRAVVETLRRTSRIVFLCVKSDNEAAIKLYTRLRFEVHQELEIVEFGVG